MQTVAVPGRVNLIGEHIDYHGLPVLPMAIDRRIRVTFEVREDRRVRAVSASEPDPVEFEWAAQLEPSPAGHWSNYVKAAAQAAGDRWGLGRGVDAQVSSDLPAAAGLSSSSALLTAFTLALLRANGISAGFNELMEVLPEAEYFVGTRGGGMDHAAVLAARRGCALLVEFSPVRATQVPIPEGWSFLIAHSLTKAEKSGAVRAEYNARRTAGTAALQKLGLASYAEAGAADLGGLTPEEARAFRHVTSEADRVRQARECLLAGDAAAFAELLNASHTSMRDDLRISNAALDELVEAARASGALGARLTGAGFGGCAVIFCRGEDRERVRRGLSEQFYRGRGEPMVIDAVPSDGALSA